MRLLLDTQLVVWLSAKSWLLSAPARALVEDREHEIFFSAGSIWEIAIKFALGREDFDVDPRLVHRGLLDNGYAELNVTSQHAAGIANLPAHHKDPFDRLLLAQAMVEEMLLVTTDAVLARYPGPIRLVPRASDPGRSLS